MRSLKPQNLFHGMEPLLGHYGVQVNRDLLVDRVNNGRMTFPIRYGETVRPVQLNDPLIPKLTIVNGNAPAVKGIDSMLALFASSVVISEQLSSKSKSGDMGIDVFACRKFERCDNIGPQSLSNGRSWRRNGLKVRYCRFN